MAQDESDTEIKTRENASKRSSTDVAPLTPQVSDAMRKVSDMLWLVCLVYTGMFSYVLTIFYRAGKTMEYRIPFRFYSFSPLLCASLFVFFTFTLLALFLFYKALGKAESATPLMRVRRLSFLLMFFVTLFSSVYLTTVLFHFFRGGLFEVKTMFVLLFYIPLLLLYMKREKSICEHAFFCVLCSLMICVIAFYAGLSDAKMSEKMVTMYNMETVSFLDETDNGALLAGFNTARNEFTGRMIMVDNKVLSTLVFKQYSPLSLRHKRNF